jgi:hypothetical protein
VESWKWPQKREMRGDVSPDQNALSLDSDDPNGHQALSCNEGSEGARGVQEVKLFLFVEVEGGSPAFFRIQGNLNFASFASRAGQAA